MLMLKKYNLPFKLYLGVNRSDIGYYYNTFNSDLDCDITPYISDNTYGFLLYNRNLKILTDCDIPCKSITELHNEIHYILNNIDYSNRL
jgi:hypothetical protein